MARDVIVALDFPGRSEALGFLDRFKADKPFVKIGMELFYREGQDMVREIAMRGHRIFLDLKLHDIPNTVAGAIRSLGQLDVDMINLHAGGGIQMMRGASEALSALGSRKPLLIAVTVLTSLDEAALRRELLVSQPLKQTVLRYAQNAKEAGLDGVVCSPLEAKGVHEAFGQDFITVTPGIRFADAHKGDQQRVTTPREARALGTDYIVVGRPITRAQDPVEVYRRCLSDFVNP